MCTLAGTGWCPEDARAGSSVLIIEARSLCFGALQTNWNADILFSEIWLRLRAGEGVALRAC